jgi:hypothetical protein
MRGLALSTLFLGMALMEPAPDDWGSRALLSLVRGLVFFVALVLIWFGV